MTKATTQATPTLPFDRTPAEVAEVEREMAERALPIAALDGLPDDREEERAYDLAHDLWDRPPGKRRRCLGCGLNAEIYFNAACWFCCVTGRADHARTTFQPREWQRMANGG